MLRTCQQCAAEFDGGANALYCSSCKQLRKREQAKALHHRVAPDARYNPMPTNTTPEPLTVREICTAANLTQSALAARFGIPKRTVEDWCRGIAKCAPYIRRMMMECLGILSK